MAAIAFGILYLRGAPATDVRPMRFAVSPPENVTLGVGNNPASPSETIPAVSPDGRLLSIRRILPEKEAAPDPGEATARSLAEAEIRELRGIDPSALRFIETTVEKRPARVDRTFIWESNTIRFGDAALRYLVEMQGDRVGRSSLHFEVPEKWRRDYETLRSKNLAAGTVATLGLLLTALAVLVVFLERVRRKDVKWKWAFAFSRMSCQGFTVGGCSVLPESLWRSRGLRWAREGMRLRNDMAGFSLLRM